MAIMITHALYNISYTAVVFGAAGFVADGVGEAKGAIGVVFCVARLWP